MQGERGEDTGVQEESVAEQRHMQEEHTRTALAGVRCKGTRTLPPDLLMVRV